MSAVAAESDLKHIVLSNSTFGPAEIRQLTQAISSDYSQFGLLRDAVAELEVRDDQTPASAVRLGVCYYLLGRYQRAIETLSNADGGALAKFYLGKSNYALGNYKPALDAYKAAKTAGYNGDDSVLASAEVMRAAGDPKGALSTLDQLFGPVESTAEYLYQRAATIATIGGNPSEVAALLERAVATQEVHVGALFGLALENDRRGNDDLAFDLYQRAAGCFPTHVGVLLNLGLMYEDMARYDRAQQCYQRILDSNPSHARARLYYKDAAASRDQFFDEDAQKKSDRLAQVLGIPVTDFELSVRSRNCLQKMGIRTLGDLTRTSEQELLASKNFGETSLIEIREMLSSKGLELGQFAQERAKEEAPLELATMSPDEQAMLDRPISDLNLSVRARKAMVRLGLVTLGDLCRKTGDDLLECKNFGVTSLNEVRERLSTISLKLRGD
jgi:DNA-directed RNA polymerase subunit alpha